ncbi:MAG: oxidoreductase, partial [Cyclobacteriaceae bacterium]|nr:oxidoreductase [Cyclobacteriaceae bacterium]
MRYINIIIILFSIAAILSCSSQKKESMENEATTAPFQFMTLDPGHFHAALVQKMELEDVDPTVYVYAP